MMAQKSKLPWRTVLPALLAALVVCSPLPAQAQAAQAAQAAEEQLAAASALYDAKKFSEAAQRLEAFLQQHAAHPKAPAGALALGRCYTELKQYARAVPAYEKAAASKDPAITGVAQLGLSEAAVQAGQWEKAAAVLEQVVRQPLKPEQAAILWFWRGEANFQLQRFAVAEESYAKVADDYGTSDFADGAFFGAALSSLRQNKPDLARRRLRTLVDRFAKSEDRPRALLLLAQLDFEAGKHKEARAGYEAALKEFAGKPEADANRHAAEEGLVNALLELQDYGAATGHLEALLARLPASDPQRLRAQLTLGHCQFRQKQYDAALVSYRAAGGSTDAAIAAEAAYWSANTSLALNRPADAAQQFAKVAADYPKYEHAARAQLRAADALVAARQVPAAVTAYQAVVARFPQAPEAGEARKALNDLVGAVADPDTLAELLKNAPPAERARGTLRLARAYLDGKKPEQCESVLTALLKDSQERDVTAEGRYLLGLAADAQRKSAPAAAALEEAVRTAPDASWAGDAHGRLAWLFLELKQPENAERAARAALGKKPDAAAQRQARLALVQAALDLQKWDLALDEARSLLGADPPVDLVPQLLYTQAWVYEKQNKGEAALSLWEHLLKNHRQTEYAAEALLRVGDARFKAQKFAEAREQYAGVLTEFPRSPVVVEARFKLGSTLYNLEKLPDAVAEWDRVIAAPTAGEWVPEALYWTGVALDRAGKKAEAAERLDRLVMQFPKHVRVSGARVRLAALKAVLDK